MEQITFDGLKKAIENNNEFIDNVDELENILRKYITISDNSKALEYIETDFMPHKVGNHKIGDDTLIINVNHALNCFSSKSGYCENCNQCYAKKSSNNYKNSCLFGLASEINFSKLSIKNIIDNLENTIKSENIKFIRFNENGDFKSFDLFKKANTIAEYFFNKYNIISYTYTHNKKLINHKDFINNSFIVMNWSIKTNDKSKKAITCNNPKDLIKYYKKSNDYVICTGNCFNCSYCKNKDDKRTIVFINHFKKSMEAGLRLGLNDNQLNTLEANKFIDYGKFLLKINNQTT